VEHIPRNAMGKINKKLLVAEVFQDEFSGDEAPAAIAVEKRERVEKEEREAKRRRILNYAHSQQTPRSMKTIAA